MLKVFVLCAYLFNLSACAMFQRSQASGYAGTDEERPSAETRNSINTPESKQIAYELGFNPKQTLTNDQIDAIEKRKQVRLLERQLDSKKEREQYSKIIPWLQSDEEKLELLSIPSIEGRQTWINQNKIWQRSQTQAQTSKELVESGDISVGMSMDLVKKSWGDPQAVEVSGNPIYKNERWKYIRQVSTSDGYKQERRLVYFEGGRVVGWETE